MCLLTTLLNSNSTLLSFLHLCQIPKSPYCTPTPPLLNLDDMHPNPNETHPPPPTQHLLLSKSNEVHQNPYWHRPTQMKKLCSNDEGDPTMEFSNKRIANKRESRHWYRPMQMKNLCSKDGRNPRMEFSNKRVANEPESRHWHCPMQTKLCSKEKNQD